MTWNKIDAKTWDAHLKTAPEPVSLQQSYAYGTAFEKFNSKAHRCVIKKDDKIIALCQIFQHRFLKFFPIMVAFKGPVWLKSTPLDEKVEILHALKQSLPAKRHLFALESNFTNDIPINGFRQIITGASTVWLNLNQPTEELRKCLDGKWRNALVKAEKSHLTAKKLGKKISDYEWLALEEWKQRKKRGYWALPDQFIPEFVEASSQNQPILTLAGLVGKEKVAGMMFLVHGNSATYHLGWSNEIGRKNNAHNLLLWKAILQLKEQGIQYLDLGGVNTKDIPGLTRFKLGTGGSVITYGGTFMPKVFG